MTPSTACYDLITSFEQFRPTAYKPTPNDVWTLGWGHTHGVREGDTCTQATAQAWLEQDVAGTVAVLNETTKPIRSQNEFDALVSLVFNIGAGNFVGSTLHNLLCNAGSPVACADQFLRWDKQAGRTLPGLTRRREAEWALFLKA